MNDLKGDDDNNGENIIWQSVSDGNNSSSKFGLVHQKRGERGGEIEAKKYCLSLTEYYATHACYLFTSRYNAIQGWPSHFEIKPHSFSAALRYTVVLMQKKNKILLKLTLF